MVVVHFYEKKKEVLNVLRKVIPTIGEDIVLKGRKGKVLEVKEVENGHIHVQVELEVIKKVTFNPLDDKKKRRK